MDNQTKAPEGERGVNLKIDFNDVFRYQKALDEALISLRPADNSDPYVVSTHNALASIASRVVWMQIARQNSERNLVVVEKIAREFLAEADLRVALVEAEALAEEELAEGLAEEVAEELGEKPREADDRPSWNEDDKPAERFED